MPKFIITVFVILSLIGAALIYIFVKVDPSSLLIVVGFLVILWIFLGGVFSLPLSYLEGRSKEHKVKTGILKPGVLRDIFRKSLRRGLICGAVTVAFLAMRYFNIFSPLNFLIAVVFLATIELFWSFR